MITKQEINIQIKGGQGIFEIKRKDMKILPEEEQQQIYYFLRDLNKQRPPSYRKFIYITCMLVIFFFLMILFFSTTSFEFSEFYMLFIFLPLILNFVLFYLRIQRWKKRIQEMFLKHKQKLEESFKITDNKKVIQSLMGNKRHPDTTCYVLSSKKNFFNDFKIHESDEEEDTSAIFQEEDEQFQDRIQTTTLQGEYLEKLLDQKIQRNRINSERIDFRKKDN